MVPLASTSLTSVVVGIGDEDIAGRVRRHAVREAEPRADGARRRSAMNAALVEYCTVTLAVEPLALTDAGDRRPGQARASRRAGGDGVASEGTQRCSSASTEGANPRRGLAVPAASRPGEQLADPVTQHGCGLQGRGRNTVGGCGPPAEKKRRGRPGGPSGRAPRSWTVPVSTWRNKDPVGRHRQARRAAVAVRVRAVDAIKRVIVRENFIRGKGKSNYSREFSAASACPEMSWHFIAIIGPRECVFPSLKRERS